MSNGSDEKLNKDNEEFYTKELNLEDTRSALKLSKSKKRRKHKHYLSNKPLSESDINTERFKEKQKKRHKHESNVYYVESADPIPSNEKSIEDVNDYVILEDDDEFIQNPDELNDYEGDDNNNSTTEIIEIIRLSEDFCNSEEYNNFIQSDMMKFEEDQDNSDLIDESIVDITSEPIDKNLIENVDNFDETNLNDIDYVHCINEETEFVDSDLETIIDLIGSDSEESAYLEINSSSTSNNVEVINPPDTENNTESNVLDVNTEISHLPSQLVSQEEIDRINLLFEGSDWKKEPQPTSEWARALFCPIVSKYFYNTRNTVVNSGYIRYDDSFKGLRPTNSYRFPCAVAMKNRILNVGRGSQNEIDLEKFGNCRFISPKHATIFYSEITHSYELLNYSQFGTYVNNIFFCINPEPNLIWNPRGSTKASSVFASLGIEEKAAVMKRRRIYLKTGKFPFDLKMDSLKGPMKTECHCDLYERKPGYEGPAILHNGAMVVFGCIPFVFSILKKYKPDDFEKKKEEESVASCPS